MNDFFEKLRQLKSNVRLEAGRKEALKYRLLRAMDTAHVRAAAPVRQNIQRSDYPLFISYFLKPKFMTVIAIIIAALLSGGVSYAAESSLPGDALYPVKIKVNEEVRVILAFSPEAKAALAAHLAERRLVEASELTAKGRMNAEARVAIEANFKAHADRVEVRIEELRARGDHDTAADIASHMETSLRAHEKILARLEEKLEHKSGAKADLGVLKAKLHIRLEEVTKSRVDLEDKVKKEDGGPEVRAAAEGRIQAAANFLAATRNFLGTRGEKLGHDSTAKAEARLKEAEEILAKAKAELAARKFGEAFIQAGQSMRLAQEARLLVDTELRLKLHGAKVELEL